MKSNVHLLFPTPIYRTNIGVDYPDNESLEFEESNNGFISVNQQYLPTNLILKKTIEKEIDNFLYKELLLSSKISVKHQCSWVLLHQKGNHSPRHYHANSWLSGIYYITVSEKSGKLRFADAVPYGWTSGNVVPDVEKRNNINSSSWEFLPVCGDLFLFPSHINHCSDINETNEDRICISFNYTLEGEWGTSTAFIKT